MALNDDIRALSGVELFREFTQDQLRLLAFGAETLTLSAGKLLYREDQPAESGFVVTRGTVVLFREIDGERRVVMEASEGTLLGAMALIAQTMRPTSAVAGTDCDVLRVNRTLFRRILVEYPETAAQLHAQISAEFAELLERVQHLGPRFSD